MKNFLEENYYIFRGLYIALARTKSSAQNVYFKVLAAQRHLFFNTKGISFSEREELSIQLLDEAMHKFYLGAFALEQLWGVHHYLETADYGLPDFYDVNLTTQQNELVFLLAYLLDQALFTWRSFLDYYLKYLLFYSTGEYIPTMSTKEFKKKMEWYIKGNQNSDRCKQVLDYVTTNVLCETFGGRTQCWGDLLKSLRDKTTHQKLISPTIIEKENAKGYIISWPTINGLSYSELAQLNFENKAFEMIRELFPILYELEWKAGPYTPGMYQ